ncbi:hypothetical protein AB0H42_32415 [Nocardia sp. NPDC050799]|uniref:hypothetical protein n=1 Tax=Nocardia sp. NPDC050799 TaxID=3154842 RepID=UPI0033DFED25
MNPLRRSYEARVLVVPLGAGSALLTADLAAFGVDGIRVLSNPDPVRALTEPLGSGVWEPPAPAGTGEVTRSADMVVLIGTDLSDVPESTVREVCAAGREGGDLLAAVLVDPQNWADPAGASAMVTLRQEVDMVISVRGPRLLAGLLDVLRGGARAETGSAAAEVSA